LVYHANYTLIDLKNNISSSSNLFELLEECFD
jgi:hypothetical protein